MNMIETVDPKVWPAR